jgi:anti-sigma B factor antagonist
MAVPADESRPPRPGDEPVIVVLPDEIDMENSLQVRQTLLAAIRRQPAGVIVNMTATSFCDSSGMGAIVYAYREAVTAGTGLRLVIGNPNVRRAFALSGIDAVIGIYPDLSAALSG